MTSHTALTAAITQMEQRTVGVSHTLSLGGEEHHASLRATQRLPPGTVARGAVWTEGFAICKGELPPCPQLSPTSGSHEISLACQAMLAVNAVILLGGEPGTPGT